MYMPQGLEHTRDMSIGDFIAERRWLIPREFRQALPERIAALEYLDILEKVDNELV